MLTPEEGVFVLAMGRKWVKTDESVVDETWMTHDKTAFRQPVEELSHQATEIRLSCEIIGTGETGVECDIGL